MSLDLAPFRSQLLVSAQELDIETERSVGIECSAISADKWETVMNGGGCHQGVVDRTAADPRLGQGGPCAGMCGVF